MSFVVESIRENFEVTGYEQEIRNGIVGMRHDDLRTEVSGFP